MNLWLVYILLQKRHQKPIRSTQLVAVMKTHLNLKSSILAKRFKFRQLVQRTEENISCYVTKLKQRLWFYMGKLIENQREQFLCGIVNDFIRQKLYTEVDVTVFDKAYKLAVSMEVAKVNAALMDNCTGVRNGDSVTVCNTTSVHWVS